MARIAGVDLPRNKRGLISLTYIYGIGRSLSAEILEKAGVDPNIKVQDWDDESVREISRLITNEYKVEGELRSEVQMNIKRLKDLEALALSHDGVLKTYAIQAGRELRVIVESEIISDEEATLVSRDIAKKIEESLTFPGQIKVTVIRETRAIEYANK